MAELPRGTVTLLFTDIEGSTRLLQELGEEAYVRALEDHRRLLREAFTGHGGVEVEMQGDSFHFAFADPCEAVLARRRRSGALPSTPGSASRSGCGSGMHTGEPLVTGKPVCRPRRPSRGAGDERRATAARCSSPSERRRSSQRRAAGRALAARPRRASAEGPVGAAAALPARRRGVPAARLALPDEPARAGDALPRARARARRR